MTARATLATTIEMVRKFSETTKGQLLTAGCDASAGWTTVDGAVRGVDHGLRRSGCGRLSWDIRGIWVVFNLANVLLTPLSVTSMRRLVWAVRESRRSDPRR